MDSKFGLVFVLFICRHVLCTSDCSAQDGKYDLTPLSRFIWNVTHRRGPDLIEYKINLCSPLGFNGSCANSSVCRLESHGSMISNLGSYEALLSIDQDADDSGFWLKFVGGPCSEGGEHRTFINLQCRKGLGSPQLIGVYGCHTYFLWETSVACEHLLPQKQVPCYTYDSQGNKYDLIGLIKDKGGYSLRTGIAPVDFYINVCADIVADNVVTGCPSGAGACRKIGQEILSFGEVDQPLVLMKDGSLQLTYAGKIIPTGCTAPSRTTIRFVCPNSGPGDAPIILSDSNCNYQIEWSIVQACPIPQLESKDGCKLKSITDGIDVDLSLLKSTLIIPHHAEGKINDKIFNYYFGICGGLPQNYSCGSENNTSLVTVCRKSIDNHQGIVIGTDMNQTLRFSDNQIYLSYTGSSICKQTGSLNKTHSTVIIFKCRRFASNYGIGELSFIQEEECISFFSWETRFACVEPFTGSICHARDGEHLIDLTSLRKAQGEEPWQAIISGASSHSFHVTQAFINVCGSVGRSGATSSCPLGAAVCVKDNEGKMQNFGQYSSPPFFDPATKDVLINYTSFEPCSTNANKSRASFIRFICQPGVMDLGPSLVWSSEDGCLLEFEWQTAAACFQMAVEGDDCRIQIPAAGLSFDLNPLRSSTYYNISTDDYDYYFNICGELKDVPCVKNQEQQAACQVDKSNENIFWSLGTPSQKLMYYNGLINLTFTNGTPYNDSARTPRQTVIIFICDRNAGFGSPLFVDESDYIYSFKWKTPYVCPPKPIECIYTDKETLLQYDLSRLTHGQHQGNWEATEAQGNKKFYFNVCQNLVLTYAVVEVGCDSSAAVCATQFINDKEETFIPNLGKAETSPQFEEGKLVLKYTSGQACPHGSSGQNYSAIIYFMCANDSISKREDEIGLGFLRELQCEYMFLWNTYAACPLRTTEVSIGCSIRNPNSGIIYSFESLTETFHIPGAESTRFQSFDINVCGVVNSSVCALQNNNSAQISACGRLQNFKDPAVLGLSTSRTLELSGEDSVIVHFNSPIDPATNQSYYRLDIIFLCRRHLESLKPKFLHEENKRIVFLYETAITCPPQEVVCVCHNGRGSTYDLSSLGHGSGHWEVRDPRQGKESVLYHLNVCRTLMAPFDSNCPTTEGVVGACESNTSSGEAWSLGQIQGKPQTSNDGRTSVTLRYLNGDLCDNGQFHRSTRINFICSTKQEEPQFVTETAQCEYIFEWKTPVACPVRRTLGRNCKVIDPVYSNIFDLSKLSNATGYEIAFGDKKFRINVCAPLLEGCDNERQAGVCIESEGRQISAGNYSDELVYDRGEITLRYEGAITSAFSFLCDYSTYGKQGPILLNSSSNESYVFVWKTSYACRNFKETSCHVVGRNNTHYDLSRLKLLDENYEVIASDGKLKYFINICHSVVHKKDVECHYGAGVCAVNISEANIEKRYSSLGDIENGPFLEKGVLKLVYDMGELCRSPRSSLLHKRTTILFYCAHHILIGKPEFLTGHGCEYVFVWYTSAACPVVQEDFVGGDCTVINPNSGTRFDLNGLRGLAYVVPVAADSNLTIGICEGAPNSPCGANIGSCVETTSTSSPKVHQNAGFANSQLHYRNGALLLNYTNWESCPNLNGSVGWTTLITFVCGDVGIISKPNFLDVYGCTYIFQWRTEFACEKQVHCTVKVDKEIFDLSPLTEYKGHHFAFSTDDNDDATYLLNVCKRLNPYGAQTRCPSDAAICRLDRSLNTSYSLGIAKNPPTIDARGNIILEYKNGSMCPFDQRLNASSRIIFKCDDRLIHDVLQMVEVTPDCMYIFEWPTDVVCSSKVHGEVTGNCSYFDTRLKMNYDYTQLQAQQPDGFKVETDKGTFTLNLCGATAKSGPCATAGVCLAKNEQEQSWGSANSKIFSADGGEILKVFYKDGDACPTGDRPNQNSMVWFVCDEDAGIGWPKLSELDDCEAIFTWRTSFVCPVHEPECIVMHQGNLYDLRLLSSYSHSWIIDAHDGEKFWINVCNDLGGKSDPRCPSDSTVCWKTSSGKVMSVGAKQNMLLSMADDGQTVLLRYSTSTNACFHGPNNAGLPTYSEIRFKCAAKVGKLRVISRGSKFNNCTFTFEWKTPIACQEHRLLEIVENDGLIKDAKRGIYLDLMPLLKANETVLEEREHDKYLYHISLLGFEFKHGGCDGAAICQTKIGETDFQRNIGSSSSKKFYFQGSEFLLILQSDSQCGRNLEKNVTSHISIQCSAFVGIGHPEFVYESADCEYVFNWQTDVVCDVATMYQLNTDSVAPASSNVGLAVGISVAVITLAVVVFVVFRNKERRNCFFLSRQSLSSISSPLSSIRQGHGSISFARLSEEEAAA